MNTLIRSTRVAATSALCVALDAAAAHQVTVEIDAAFGDSHVDVQAIVDANPENTTFLLKGTFNFGDHVHIEKSGTRIIGDWTDVNGNGKPDESDTWNTIIRSASGTVFLEGFKLLPADEFTSDGFFVSDIEIKGIRFSEINVPIAVPWGPSDDQVACRTEALPYELEDITISENWIEGGGIVLYRRVSEASISNNLFTLFQGEERFRHGVEMKGYTINECGQPSGVEAQGQDRVSISGNEFTGGRDISVGFQTLFEVSDNTLGGVELGSYKLWMELVSDTLINDNTFDGAGSSGIYLWSGSRSPELWPGSYTTNLTVSGNAFIDITDSIVTFGGVKKSSFSNNTFSRSGLNGPVGSTAIAILDVAPVEDFIVTEPSAQLSIKNNTIAGAGVAGVLLNGATTGVTVVNNSYSNPFAVFGDVLLAPTDIVFGGLPEASCPAQGNKVIALDSGTIVTDGYEPICADSKPNKVGSN